MHEQASYSKAQTQLLLIPYVHLRSWQTRVHVVPAHTGGIQIDVVLVRSRVIHVHIFVFLWQISPGVKRNTISL